MARLNVLKTYKIFINGEFPRTESGRYYPLNNAKGETVANVCLSSRKDVRNAVEAARKGVSAWSGKTAYNRAQILYRIAEVLEGRKAQFVDELVLQGYKTPAATTEVEASIDLLVYYAGWADKYQQLYSTVNPVATKHFNFSYPENTGVVSIIAPADSGLLGLVKAIAPALTGGNAVIALAAEKFPLCAISFAEVIATADVPAATVNILTGTKPELLQYFANHMDVNAIVYYGSDAAERKLVDELASLNVKRAIHRTGKEKPSPMLILDTVEIKTTWHPVGF